MKKAKRNVIISAIMAIALCISLMAGATFALFTDKSEVNIAVTSGKVDIEATISGFKATSPKTIASDGSVSEYVDGFINGGFAEQVDNVITLKKITPGDKVTFTITVKNFSNVKTQYRTVVKSEHDDGLFAGLEFTVNGVKVNGATPWKNLDIATDTDKGDLVDTYECVIELPVSAGNKYQDKTCDIVYTVEAVQGNAQLGDYPTGITPDSFPTNTKAVDNDGNFYTTFKEAMENVSDNGVLYFKENDTVDFATHLNVTKNVTIYANGTDFSGKDISIGTYAAPLNKETTVNIYDAKNLVVWGEPKEDFTWNVNFYNCVNDNYNFFMFRGGETPTAKINLTLTDCSASGYSDSIIHTTADGSIVVKNCTFTDNCAPVNISHKQNGTMKVTVEDCKFINCGKVNPENDYFAPARFVNNNQNGTLEITLTNNVFSGTIGTNGDILLGDYRTGKASYSLTATINTVENVKVKSSYGEAYECGSGTIALYSLEEFNALERVPEKLLRAYVNIGDVSLQDGNVTIGNKNICDEWTWDKDTNHKAGEVLDDGRKVYMVRTNDTIYSSNKPGFTLYISGSVNDNKEGGLNNKGDGNDPRSVTLSIPDASNAVFTEDFTVNGYFRMFTGWSDGRNLGGAFYNRSVKNVTFDHSVFNGIWIQNGGFYADNITFDGCTFNPYENKVSANDSNPLWFCNINSCDITIKNCSFNTSRPVKVVEQTVNGANIKIINNKFNMSVENSANDVTKPKNVAIQFSTIKTESRLGNVEITGNTVVGDIALLTFFNPSQITMAEGATFKVSGNTYQGKLSVEWKTDTEYIPDFVAAI